MKSGILLVIVLKIFILIVIAKTFSDFLSYFIALFHISYNILWDIVKIERLMIDKKNMKYILDKEY